MTTEQIIIIFLLLTAIVLLIFVALWLRKLLSQSSESRWQELIDLAYSQASQKVSEQSKQILAGEREVIKTDLQNKHQEMVRLVDLIKKDLHQSNTELAASNKDRATQFATLAKQLDQQRQLTETLSTNTQELKQLLSNNQQRGGWGERILDDLLRANGLIEGIHYVRQKQLEDSTDRPDVLLLLPGKRVVPIDVKFPLAELQNSLTANTSPARSAHEKAFASDVKAKVDQVAKYIQPGAGTLDYAILFVPNEGVFSYINQFQPQVVDHAIGRRVLITSPFTFLIVARTIIESYRNFLLGDQLQEVMKNLDGFMTEWQKFDDSFSKIGKTIDTLQKDYHAVSSTRVAKLTKKVQTIQRLSLTAVEETKEAEEDGELTPEREKFVLQQLEEHRQGKTHVIEDIDEFTASV